MCKEFVMSLKRFIYRIFNKEYLLSSEDYAKWLRNRGVRIGQNLQIMHLGYGRTPTIDLTRPSLVDIGDNVLLHRNFTLLTHDFVTRRFLEKYDDFIPSSGKVKIGNNVSFGMDCTVLKGVTIGDNCYIGAGSIVTKDIPSDSVAVGRPAKVVCTIADYYERRKKECINEAFEYARSIKEQLGRNPLPSDFKEEFVLFVDSRNIEQYLELIPIKKQLGVHYEKWLETHNAQFESFEEFLAEAGVL